MHKTFYPALTDCTVGEFENGGNFHSGEKNTGELAYFQIPDIR